MLVSSPDRVQDERPEHLSHGSTVRAITPVARAVGCHSGTAFPSTIGEQQQPSVQRSSAHRQLASRPPYSQACS